MTNCVLIGADGMLGRELEPALVRAGYAVTRCADRRALDITDRSAVEAALPDSVDLVVNAAAYTAVDQAEAEPAAAMRVNATGPAHLAERCRAIGATLVHYSTDYVFGDALGDPGATAPDPARPRPPIPVDATPRPLNVYGLTKLAGEQAIRASGAAHLILRTSWLFAPHGSNFVRTILRLVAGRDELSVVDDQRGRPTSCRDLAEITCRLLAAPARGTFHAANDGTATWCELARAIVEGTGSNCRIAPCTTGQFPRPARRARHGVLDLDRTTALIGPVPSWRQALEAALAAIARSAAPSTSASASAPP